MTTIRVALVAIVAGLSLTCKDQGAPPITPPANVTTVWVSLTTPNADDGALLITVRGPGLATAQAAVPAYLVFSNLATPQETRLIVIGDLVAGSLFSVAVAGTNPLADYSASIEQVATRADAVRANLTGYRLSVAAAR